MEFQNRPKYYAARFFAGAYNSAGGIKINHRMEVLDRGFDVIPGLYAAGVDANSMYTHTYAPLAGNYMGFAVTSGRLAARHALEYIESGGN
jgi:fumarate reductase flavoprotein subunit